MKKLSIFMLALLTISLVGCKEDYPSLTGPQTNLPESQLQASDITVAATRSDFNIADFINTETGEETPIEFATVMVKEGAMPANTYMMADVEISRTADFEKSTTLRSYSLKNGNTITLMPSELEEAYFNDITKNPAQTVLYARITLYTVTDETSVACIGKPGESYFAEQSMNMTPLMKVKISKNYYIVGGPNDDWAGSAAGKAIKFSHSGEDVYVDPIFTVIFDAKPNSDTWFAIGDEETCDAFASGQELWNNLLGIKESDEEGMEGTMDFRYNLGGDHSFCVPAGAKKIRVTINMMEYSFKIEAVNIADAYYLIGDMGTWGNDKSLKMSHSDKDVFEDPVFTYVFAGGKDTWFAFGDAEALDAIDSGDWNQLFGTKGASEDFSGSFDRRYNLGGDHSFHVDGSAKFYRFTINALDMTYEITPLNFDPYIYFIGATDGWSNAEQRLALTDESGIYTGYLYCADPNGWGNEFKFQKVPGDWDSQVNADMMTGGITGDFAAGGGGNFKANAGEAVYFVTLNMANMSINAVKVEKMGIIGDFNRWGGDYEMTWNATDYCFEATGVGATAEGWKFRINSDWAINLGGTTGNLVANGDNLFIDANTVKLYPTRKGAENIYCTVE